MVRCGGCGLWAESVSFSGCVPGFFSVCGVGCGCLMQSACSSGLRVNLLRIVVFFEAVAGMGWCIELDFKEESFAVFGFSWLFY